MGSGTIGTPDAFKTEVERRIEVLEARVARLEHPGSHDAHVDEVAKYIAVTATEPNFTDKVAQRIIDAEAHADRAAAQATDFSTRLSHAWTALRDAGFRPAANDPQPNLAALIASSLESLRRDAVLATDGFEKRMRALAQDRQTEKRRAEAAEEHVEQLLEDAARRDVAQEQIGCCYCDAKSDRLPTMPARAAWARKHVETECPNHPMRGLERLLRSAHSEVSARNEEVQRGRTRIAAGRKVIEEYLAQHAICGEEEAGHGCPCGDCDAARAWLGRPASPGEPTTPRGSVTGALAVLRWLAAKDCTSRDMHERARTCIEAKSAKPWCEHCTAHEAIDALDGTATEQHPDRMAGTTNIADGTDGGPMPGEYVRKPGAPVEVRMTDGTLLREVLPPGPGGAPLDRAVAELRAREGDIEINSKGDVTIIGGDAVKVIADEFAKEANVVIENIRAPLVAELKHLRDCLAAVIPYAETRAEDMSDSETENAAPAAAAWRAVTAAKKAIGLGPNDAPATGTAGPMLDALDKLGHGMAAAINEQVGKQLAGEVEPSVAVAFDDKGTLLKGWQVGDTVCFKSARPPGPHTILRLSSSNMTAELTSNETGERITGLLSALRVVARKGEIPGVGEVPWGSDPKSVARRAVLDGADPLTGVSLAAGPDPDPSDVPACGEQPSVEVAEAAVAEACNCPTAHGPASVLSHDCPVHGRPVAGA